MLENNLIEEIKDILYKEPYWKKTKIDSWEYFITFTDDTLEETKDFLKNLINFLEEEKIDKSKLEEKEKNLEDFALKYLKEGAVKELKIEGVERFLFSFEGLYHKREMTRRKWIVNNLQRAYGKSIPIIEDRKNKTWRLKYPEHFTEEALEEIKEWREKGGRLDDTIYKKYFKRLPNVKKLNKEKDFLINEYKTAKLEYMNKIQQKEVFIERVKRIIWFIEIEESLREYEKKENLKFNRLKRFYTAEGEETNNYKINPFWLNLPISLNEKGEIRNIFIIENNIPFRLLGFEYKKTLLGEDVLSTGIVEKRDLTFEDFCWMTKKHQNANMKTNNLMKKVEFFYAPVDKNDFKDYRFFTFLKVNDLDEGDIYNHSTDKNFRSLTNKKEDIKTFNETVNYDFEDEIDNKENQWSWPENNTLDDVDKILLEMEETEEDKIFEEEEEEDSLLLELEKDDEPRFTW